jgi:2-methylcitrate dehydratase
MDGAITLRSYDAAHLTNPRLHALMQKITVNENREFTAAFNAEPQEHRARITVVMDSGKQFVGETGGDEDDMSGPASDVRIEEKFRGLTEGVLGAKRVQSIVHRLWHLEEINSVAEIPHALVIC